MQNNKSEQDYIINLQSGLVATESELSEVFYKQSKEFRLNYYNNHKEFIFQMEKAGKYIRIQRNGYIVSNKIFTPRQYGILMKLKVFIPTNVSVAEFDEIVADNYNLLNFHLTDYSEIVENGLQVVVVKFKNGDYRFVEVR